MAPKPLSDYPRPPHDNGRGVHWSAGIYHISGNALAHWINELKALQIKWVRLLDSSGSSVALCKALVENDIMPIVRLYKERPNPGAVAPGQEGVIKALLDVGVHYFETNNEPDLVDEWKKGKRPKNWLEHVVDDFITDADVIQNLGGLPGFPAMSTSCKANGIAQVVARGRKDIFEKGAWLAIHNYTLNHPPEYPYDDVNQKGKPLTQQEYDELARWQYSHLSWKEVKAAKLEINRENYDKFNRWAWGGRTRKQVNAVRAAHKNPGATLQDDSSTFLSWQFWGQQAHDALGFYIPIIGTEGGPVTGWGDDDRYAKVNPFTQADWQMQIVQFLQDEAPPWFFTTCTWLLGSEPLGHANPTWEQMSWYTHVWDLQFGLNGELPVVQRLKEMPAQVRHELRISGPRAAVRGQVIGKDGKPVPHLAVGLRQGEQMVVQGKSDAQGHFSLIAKPGVYDLVVPWLGVVAHDITLEQADVDAIDVQIEDAPSHYKISGKLLGLSGRPLAEAEVQLRRNGEIHAQTYTDAQGGFSFEPALAGTYQLVAENASTQVTVSLKSPEVEQDLNVTSSSDYRYVLVEKRLLSAQESRNKNLFFGKVSDMTGAGLNGIVLEMRWKNAAADQKFPRTTTGSNLYKPDGYYEFVHTPGEFMIQVVQGDYESDVAEGLKTDFTPNRPACYEVNFQLQAMNQEAKAGGIKGSVPGGRVEQVVRLWRNGKVVAETELDTARSFQFMHLEKGFYDLELAGIGMILFDIDIDGRHHRRIRFPLMGAIKGQVKGVKKPSTSIKLISETYGFTRHSALSATGHYRFTHLPQGVYRIELGDALLTGLELKGSEVLEAPLLRTGAQATTRQSEISGQVHDASHRPVPHVQISLITQGEVLAVARSNIAGRYHFSGLPAGIYEVRIGEEAALSDLVLDGQNQVTANVLYAPILATALSKQLGRYYLLQMQDPALLPGLIRLLAPWLSSQPEGSLGFSLTEAQFAETVVLLGDGLPDSTINLLQEADCEIIDMRGNLLTLAYRQAA